MMRPRILQYVFNVILGSALALSVTAQNLPNTISKQQQQWADSVFNTLTVDERIAQLLFVAATSDVKRSLIGTTTSNPSYVEDLIKNYKVGGVVFFQGGPVPQAQLTNRFQAVSKVPLLVAMDAEFGLAMRIDSTVRYPYQLTLGAIQGNNHLIYQMGAELAQQALRLGVHINFAPVADINNNPNNPVINFRSFGENKHKVTEKAIAYMKGMQDNGLLTSAKHFPGHGDTDTDSHYTLPLIQHNRARLDSVELYPFKEMIKAGLSGAMIAHLSIPSLDNTPNLPSTLSKKIVTDLLRKELGFQGLIYSDAMNMKGITSYFQNGEADAKGLEAGMDILEFTEDVPKAIVAIKKAIQEGRITQAEIDSRCRRILAAKAWVGLDKFKPIATENLYADLNPKQAELTNRLLTEKALTVLVNKNDILPLKSLDTLRIASVSIGATTPTLFQQTAELYTKVDHFTIGEKPTDLEIDQLIQKLQPYNLILSAAHLYSIRPGVNYGVNAQNKQLIQKLNATDKNVLIILGNPYALLKLENPESARALVMGYQLTDFTQELSAQLIFGAIPAEGRLPVSVNQQFPYLAGISTPSLQRLKYTIPEEVGLKSDIITAKIDSIMAFAIAQQATPGGVVQLAKDGKVFFRKAYGKHTYEGSTPVNVNDLYDLASVTKITAATLGLMSVYDKGLFNLDATAGDYLPFTRKTPIDTIRWRDMLTHKAGLKAFIPLWRDTQNADGTWKKNVVHTKMSRKYPTELVADKLYLRKNYKKHIYKRISEAPINPSQGYVYSDFSFILYPEVIHKLTGVPFEHYLYQNFYNKLGANSLTFNPRKKYSLNQIVPTENDTLFRKELVHGTVHDEVAAMLGGVSGHAGLYGNANDVMKVWQLFLQKGAYGGEKLISAETVDTFTAYQFPEIKNRRGLGFDKPSFTFSGNAPRYASPASYGHTGFTGIMTWADPSWGLNYVFLSNRVYPYRSHGALGTHNIRTNIMDVIYKELLK